MFDYVIVGAGAAGCILASRLTEDSGAQVLLLEAGARRRSPLMLLPAADTLLIGNPRFDWCYRTEPDPTLNQRRLSIPRGRLLGGSNQINGTLFVRGQRKDFDDWAQNGATGWGWEDVLPYFRRLEDFRGAHSETRGDNGPIAVGEPARREPLCDAFIAAAVQLGYQRNLDYNSGDLEGFGYYQGTHLRGRRVSVVDGYLGRPRPNLSITTEAVVTALAFEGTRCTGLIYRRGDLTHHVKAAREVILAAGVIGSPQLLELSGIGDLSVLARAGITAYHTLPAVGENFHDHFAARLRWRVRQSVSFNERTRGFRLLGEVGRYLFGRGGVLALPIAMGFGFVKSSPEETLPDLQFHFSPASYGTGSTRCLDERPGMTIGVYPLKPRSRGSIHVHTADATQAPAIRPSFLGHEEDVRRLVAGMRLARRIVAAPACEPFRGEETCPGREIEREDELRDHLRAHGDTSFHPVGTCAIGGVVDPRLRVLGLHGLRVVDASVMPAMVSGNTQAATMMIAEKGAAMILEDARA